MKEINKNNNLDEHEISRHIKASPKDIAALERMRPAIKKLKDVRHEDNPEINNPNIR